jgi:hypothetical protein
MDIQDGFHSLEIDKEDSEITPDFTMSFLRLPMGAKNSPALFCAVVGYVFRDFMVTRLQRVYRRKFAFYSFIWTIYFVMVIIFRII